jgi:succinyl-CoA synthetase beta subunit
LHQPFYIVLFPLADGSMKIHEFQAKQLLKGFGVAVPEGSVAESADAARAIAEKMGREVVVKAHIHAGGRGKAGGV